MSEEANAEAGTEGAAQGGEDQAQQPDKIVEIAKAVGWKEGGPLDAETFIKGMPGRFHDQTRTMQELKRSVEGITKHFATTVERQVQERVANLEASKEQAILAGDVKTVKEIDKQIKDAEKTEIPKGNAIAPEVKDFVDRNTWFDKDAKMTRRAVAYKDEYLLDNPGADLKDALDYAEAEVKKAFPDKFEATETVKRPTAAAVESPNGGASNTQTWQGMKAKMNSFEKEAMADILKQTHNGKPITTEKAFIESMMASGAFEGRK